MKRNLLLLSCALLSAQFSQAQITITQSGYPASVLGTDSIKHTTVASAFPTLTAAAGGTWDMTVVTDTTPVYYAYRVATSPAQFADSNLYYFSTYSYQGNVQSSITASAITETGINVQYAAYVLPSATTDSIFFPAQSSAFTTARTVLALPATYHTSWSSVFSNDIGFQITYVPAYSHTPGIVRTYTTEKDSVIGWGTMRIKNLAGTATGYMPVLQVQTTTMTVDSFFLAGAPASALVLGSLGLTQGQMDTTWEQNYYRAGEVTPLAKVEYTRNFAQPTSAATHTQRLTYPSVGFSNISNAAGITVYPNPVSGSAITVDVPTTGGAWSYELINVTGQSIANGALQSGSTKVQLPVVAPGIYYIRVANNGAQVAVKALEVSK